MPPEEIQAGAPPLVLASTSATRRAILQGAGLRFAVIPPGVDEESIKTTARAEGWTAMQAALALAHAKAAAVTAPPDALVIGADQILSCEGAWFDKPPDLAVARAHLIRLRGRPHTLHTALVCHRNGQPLWSHCEEPCLTMRAVSDAFLEAYLRAEAAHVTASVGAYRLEGPGAQLFDAVTGEHSAILGLPLLPLLRFLRAQGVLLA